MLAAAKPKRRRRLALPRSKAAISANEPEAAEGKRHQGRTTSPSSNSHNRIASRTQESPAPATRGRPPVTERCTSSDTSPCSTISAATTAVDVSNASGADAAVGGEVDKEKISLLQDLRSSKVRKCQRADCQDTNAAAAAAVVAIDDVDPCQGWREQGLYHGKSGSRDRTQLETMHMNARPETAAGRGKRSNANNGDNENGAIPVLNPSEDDERNENKNHDTTTNMNNTSNNSREGFGDGGGGGGPDQPGAPAPDSGNGRRKNGDGKSNTQKYLLRENGEEKHTRPQRQPPQQRQPQQQQQQQQQKTPPRRKRRRPAELPSSPASPPPPQPPRQTCTAVSRPAEGVDDDGGTVPRAGETAPEGGLAVEVEMGVEGSSVTSRPRVERRGEREATAAAEKESGGGGGGGGRGGGGEGGDAGRRTASATPKREGSSGERCPVCGSAVWGLSVRARQASSGVESVVGVFIYL